MLSDSTLTVPRYPKANTPLLLTASKTTRSITSHESPRHFPLPSHLPDVVESKHFVQIIALRGRLDPTGQAELIGQVTAPLHHQAAGALPPVVGACKADMQI